MTGSMTSAFGEPDDLETALGQECGFSLLVTGRGRFRARLTQVALHRVWLLACQENLSRIAFITVPGDKVLITLSFDSRPAPTWGGVSMRGGEFLSFGPGHRVHAWTDGPVYWNALFLPVRQLTDYGRVLIGRTFAIPSGARLWRPPPAAIGRLRRLHANATRIAGTQPEVFVVEEAAHGLEQQLFDAAIECISTDKLERAPIKRNCADTVVRLEHLLQAAVSEGAGLAKACERLGVSVRFLSCCCNEQIGMSPGRYMRLRRMQLVRRGLLTSNPDESVTEIARRYGFADLGRFAATYRATFGELPSATWRRSSSGAVANLAPRSSRRRAEKM